MNMIGWRINFNSSRSLLLAGFIILGVSVSFLYAYRLSVADMPTPAEGEITTHTDDVAQHLSTVRDISLEEARMRADWQNRADTLQSRLMTKLPDSDFGGMWIDEDTDRVKVGVLHGSKVGGASRVALNTEIDRANLAAAVDFVAVEHSYTELKQATEWIVSLSQRELPKAAWPIQVGIIPSDNTVFIDIPEDKSELLPSHQAVISAIKARYSDAVQTTTYTEVPENASCNMWFCDSPLRGAVGIKGSNGGYEDGIDCTAGFNVVGNSGTRYVVTAGHCAPVGNGWATEGSNYTTKKIGPIHDTLYGQNGIDAMIIQIKESTYNWVVRGWVYVRGGTAIPPFNPPSRNEAYDITGAAASGGLEGARVCVSGAISSYYEGGSCGSVRSVDISLTIDGITNTDIVRAALCVRLGDSGGPVFRDGKALGIVKATAGAPCGEEKYYTGMNPIIRGFNHNISIF